MAASYNEIFGLGSHSPDSRLVSWYRCADNAANTTVVDDGPGGHTGTLNGGDNTADKTTAGPNSWLTAAFDFNGSDDYVNTGRAYSSNELTTDKLSILARIRPDSLTAAYGITGERIGYALNFRGDVANDPLIFTIFTVADISSSASSVTTNWQSVAVTYDQVNVIFYRNGAQISSHAQTSALPNSTNASYFGAWNNLGTPAGYFDGGFCDLVIASNAFTADEVDEWNDGPEPVNTVAPALSGTETEGETLSCTTGTWALPSPFSSGSNGTITYSYQWTRSDDAGGTGEANIGGATSSTYTLTATDVGKFIRCYVRATNDGGYDVEADTPSDMSGEIQAAGGGGGITSPLVRSKLIHSPLLGRLVC